MARDSSGFHDSLVTSTALWLSGLPGVAASPLWWKDTSSVSGQILQGATKGISQNRERVQKDRRMLRTSYFPLTRVLL